jgi:hypothetical protein
MTWAATLFSSRGDRGRSWNEDPAGARPFVTIDKRVIDNHLRPGHVEGESHLVNALTRQRVPNGSLVVLFTIQKKESTSSGPGNLAA